jgi:hypothetical protein
MPSITLVDARDLERWASSRRAQEELPALVRRLIHATTTTATHIGLPAGDAVQQGGYDGVVVINEDHHAIPNGMSIWEFGVSSNPKGKADKDYEERKARQPESTAGPVDPPQTTFVFVTPRRWNAKTKWLKTRRGERFWRDVRVLDVDDLEAWLEQAPAVHVWFSTLLGRRPVGADDLQAVWQDWSDSTTPRMSPDLMFAGRKDARDSIRAWFTDPSADSTLGVESESVEETVALVGAAIQSMPVGDRVAVLSRTVVVRDVDALLQVAASDTPLRIVTTFNPGDAAHRATRRGHRVLIPRNPGEGVAGTIEVPRLHRHAAEEALKAMGVSEDRARDLSLVARRSVMSLRRRLATSAAVSRPAWAATDVGPSLLPIFLLGTVNEAVAGDAEALSLLAGEPAEAAFARLTRHAAESDPPVRRVGEVWYIVSKADAWETLARYLTRDVLERFVAVAVGVLSAPDPSYELPPEQRFAASLFKKERAHSGLLLASVADTLALLGTRGGTHIVSSGVTAADYAGRVIRQLFEVAGRDWHRWAAFQSVLPSLMEAAPDAVLSAIEDGLAGDGASPILGLFGHDTDALFGAALHSALLWALERVAWSPDYLSRAALILAELDRRDPGGRYANRPRASLRTIFLPWAPGTAAPVDVRLAVIDMMRHREPEAAWRLMNALLPKLHDHATPSARPYWRDWAPERERGYSPRAVAHHAVEVVHRMLEDAGTSPPRWTMLVEALGDVPDEAHQAILTRLRDLADASIPDELRQAIWNALRELLSNHRSFAEAEWALPAQHVDAIAQVFACFEPADPVARQRYLFSDRPMLPEGRDQDFEDHPRLVATRRVEAAREWYAALGSPQELVRIGSELARADSLGDALAESGVVPAADVPVLVRSALGHPDARARALGRAYLARLQQQRGVDAVPELLREHGAEWPPATKAEALLAMPQNPETWRAVEALGDVGRTHYWHNVGMFWIEDGHGPRAMRELVRHERPHAAVDLAATLVRQKVAPPAEDLAHTLLEAAPVARDVTGYRSDSYDLAEIVAHLEKEVVAGRIAEDEVARLELLFLPLLKHDRQPELLHKAMGSDPSLFVEAACLAFRAEGEGERELDDAAHGRALLAYELLSGWRRPPGLNDGLIDAAHLDGWVDEARRRLAESNRAAIGDQLIGQVLSGSPVGSDGAWPAEPVREVIERLKTDDLEAGLHMGRFNQRGVTTRGPLSGGDQERSIKVRYEADAAKLAARWPRTAAFLRGFASTYERDATREDLQAELQHDLMG